MKEWKRKEKVVISIKPLTHKPLCIVIKVENPGNCIVDGWVTEWDRERARTDRYCFVKTDFKINKISIVYD